MTKNNITNKIINGALWTIIQIILMKLISFGSQIALAWILLPEDFGKIALVYTITNVSSLMQQFGLQDVLIKRGLSFNKWLPLSFGLTASIAFLSIIISNLCGFVGSYIYSDIEIFYLVLVFSISMPFQAFSIIPDTKLKIDLCFKQISIFKVIEIFLIQLFTIGFAILGFGVMSFVLPMVIVSIFRCVFLYRYTMLKFVKPSLQKWKYLTYNSFQGLLFAIFSRLSMQVDVMILGLITTQAVVGVYFMGMTLSTQVIGFLGVSLPTILFPALMSYSGKNLDKVKLPLQKVIVYMSLIGVPFALWQGTNAKPLISMFLNDKWLGSIPYVQILSIGMIFRLISSSWVVPLKLGGEFKRMSRVTLMSLIQLLLILIPMAYFFKGYGVAIGVTIFYFFNCLYLIYQGFKKFNISYYYLINKCVKIVFFAFLSYGLIFYISEKTTYIRSSNILNFLFNTLVSSFFYLVFIFLFVKEEVIELLNKLKKYNV